MVSHARGLARVTSGLPVHDRFAHYPRRWAWLVLAVLAMWLVIAANTRIIHSDGIVTPPSLDASQNKPRARDDDLALYDGVIARIEKGEHYYDFIVEDQRKSGYPVRPGLAVRLPTLAYLDAWLGASGQRIASVLLLLAVLLAWWRRLGEEPGGKRLRHFSILFLLIGASIGLVQHFFVLHELWAGSLLALSFGLHRPGRKWGWALLAAAMALSIREHALPFVLLMAAMALWRRDWKEGAAWSALAALFVAALALHLSIIAAQTSAGDPQSASWFALRGVQGWFSNLVLSSNLRFFPYWAAGPLIVLMVLGWAGWKSPAGNFGTLLFLGYGLAFMLAGRNDNYYWGMIVAPCMFMGLAYAPMALASLVRSATANAK